MIKEDEFPFTGSGKGWQEEYKGYDMAVYIEKYKGIKLYVFNDGRLLSTVSRDYISVSDMFVIGRKEVDRLIESASRKKTEMEVKKSVYYKKKCRAEAINAFRSTCYFKGIEGKTYDDALALFEYEIDKNFGKII
ncbi:hypothetical protein [uncultured Bacteroides sp.]|uniref:hypothetical protein n=1 Tax=uncultured Bacteroides sp. TaxID=162156 RepID=UPI002AA7CA42|nr:hypothetical protein [uncultured Bacteroides sp.]